MRRIDALRRPLELAAADGFRGVRKVSGLGHALRAATDALMTRVSDGALAALAQWRTTLATWESLDEMRQAEEVARGMRLIARFPRPVATVSRASAPGLRAESVPPRANPPTSTPSPTSTSPAKAASPTSTSRAKTTAPTPASPRPASPTGAPASPTKSALPTNAPASPTKAASSTSSANAALSTAASSTRAKAASSAKAASPTSVVSPVVEASKPTKARKAKASDEAPIDPLAAPTSSLKGIGPTFAQALAEKGLVTVEDLLWMVPRRYDDVRDAKSLAEVCEMPEGGRVTLVAKVASARMVFARGRRWAEVRLVAVESSPSGQPANALVRWFNVWAGIDKRMPPGSTVALSGVVKKREGRTELANPDVLGVEIAAEEGAARPAKERPSIIARYPDVPGVPPGRLRSACAAACASVAGGIDDGVPASVEKAAGLVPLGETIARLHVPDPSISSEELAAMNAGTSRWQRRLAFGELFALGVAITLRRRERRQDAAVPCVADVGGELARVFPFALTKAQRRSIDEMCTDVARDVPMNRLLQGDVGAGKTAVAFAAALHVARAGRQTAVMAPTELLAEQHFETWSAWAKKVSPALRIELLTASTPKGVRASLLALLAAGQVDIVIGTHSLLAEGVGFGALGLVVIDEQHRFGVAQRAKLRDKGDGNGAPHLLVMTATPIPRTLALTAYGDLDVSVLDEMPPGRKPVTTKQLSGKRGIGDAWKLIEKRVAMGERAYVVCPKVEPGGDDDESDLIDATTTAAELAKAMPKLRVGLVHGRLDALERDRVMRAFKQGELDVLVATTVIEVGVDVPAATVMVVLDADRFGLAQLHQLRGRVGRGGGEAHCVLVARGGLGEDAETRLGAMVETHDGFKIAEYDLLLRGPGEVLGARQAGVPRLRFGDLSQHTELLLEARRFAEQILDEDPALARPEHGSLRRAIDRRFTRHVYGAESG